MNRIGAGSAFLLRDRKVGTHLYLVLTDPDDTSRLVVAAALVSERQHTDKTCRLDAGDHPFIRYASNIDYGSPTFVPISRVSAWLNDGRATPQPELSVAVLQRVQAGLLASSRTIHVIAEHCRAHFDE